MRTSSHSSPNQQPATMDDDQALISHVNPDTLQIQDILQEYKDEIRTTTAQLDEVTKREFEEKKRQFGELGRQLAEARVKSEDIRRRVIRVTEEMEQHREMSRDMSKRMKEVEPKLIEMIRWEAANRRLSRYEYIICVLMVVLMMVLSACACYLLSIIGAVSN